MITRWRRDRAGSSHAGFECGGCSFYATKQPFTSCTISEAPIFEWLPRHDPQLSAAYWANSLFAISNRTSLSSLEHRA